jgi:hypothetical protein
MRSCHADAAADEDYAHGSKNNGYANSCWKLSSKRQGSLFELHCTYVIDYLISPSLFKINQNLQPSFMISGFGNLLNIEQVC